MPPFSLGTIIAGEEKGLVDGSVRSLSAIIWISFSASLRLANGNLYGGCFIDFVPGIRLI